jgi:hypothetical protein
MKLFRAITIAGFFLLGSNALADEDCVINDEVRNEILEKIAVEKNILNNLANCYSLDRKLILQATIADYKQFQYASPILKKDEGFIYRLIRVSPKILQFVAPSLRSDANFMKRSTYLYRDALQYASPKLLDNKMFMTEMVNMDSRNYMFAQERIKAFEDIAIMALSDNGLLLSSAPESIKSNKNLVKIAINSNVLAFDSASEKLKNDKELLQLVKTKTIKINQIDLANFINTNYVAKEERNDLGTFFVNRAKFGSKTKIVDRNYITKWQRKFFTSKNKKTEELRLVAADKKNYPITWKQDFKNNSDLIEKIQNFFLKHNIDQNTIDNLSTTFLWQVKGEPLTYVFNLYMLRDSRDIDFGSEFSNITSLTAIVEKQKDSWKMTVIDVIFDSEVKVDVAYENGHKRYVLWDIDNSSDNAKIIFKVEDKFKNYFEIFAKQNGTKYTSIAKIDISASK